MHYLITILTEAEDEKEAFSKSNSFANSLVERGEFDWFDTNGRWGKSKAVKLTSKKGQEQVKQSLEWTRSEFDRALSAVKKMMNKYTDDEIFNEQFDKEEYYASRYQFTVLGGGSNSNYLYGEDSLWGSAIANPRELKVITDKHDQKKIWVVQIDFHN